MKFKSRKTVWINYYKFIIKNPWKREIQDTLHKHKLLTERINFYILELYRTLHIYTPQLVSGFTLFEDGGILWMKTQPQCKNREI